MDLAERAPWSFWNRDEFYLQQCLNCQAFQHPHGHVCAQCHHSEMAWAESSTRAKVVSWSVVHRAPAPAFKSLFPYTIALVELEKNGPLLELWYVDDRHPKLDSAAEPVMGACVVVTFADVAGRRLPVVVPSE